jgi:T5orf172 domain
MELAAIAALGQEPSAAHLEPFIVAYLEQHGPTKRIDLANAIEAAWDEVSDRAMTADVMAKVKKALQRLVDRGTVVQTGVLGVWKLAGSGDTQSMTRAPNPAGPFAEVAGQEADEVVDGLEEMLPESNAARIELGEGDQLVYCFYLPTYRNQAEREGHDRWPVKIGMTTGPLTTRIAAQTTALPEPPTVAVIIRTHDADLLEKAIQSVLSYRDRWISEAGGAEWYLTNPEEIVSIFEFVRGLDDIVG